MSKKNFIIWLRGFAELVGRTPTPAEWEVVKDHIKLVHEGVQGAQQTWPLEPYYLGHHDVIMPGAVKNFHPVAITC